MSLASDLAASGDIRTSSVTNLNLDASLKNSKDGAARKSIKSAGPDDPALKTCQDSSTMSAMAKAKARASQVGRRGSQSGSMMMTASGALKASGEESSLVASGEEITATLASAEDISGEDAAVAESEEQVALLKPEEDEDLDTFKAEPLHVRYLCRIEHRRTAREVSAEETRLQEMHTELDDYKTSASRKQEVQEEITRLEYQINVRKQRIDRLCGLNPRTHEELPDQLIRAAREGDAAYVQMAYHAKVDVNVQDKDLMVTPLIMATIYNKVTVVKQLLELGANLRVVDANGATCVHYAVQLDHVHALATMLDVNPGQDWDVLTLKDSRNLSAVDYARRPERIDCLKLLQNRMGGPIPVVWQVFKGWMSDKCGCCRPTVNKARHNTPRKGCCFQT